LDEVEHVWVVQSLGEQGGIIGGGVEEWRASKVEQDCGLLSRHSVGSKDQHWLPVFECTPPIS